MERDSNDRRFPVGATVELIEPAAGYEAGTRGVIVRSSGWAGSAMVRFDNTGHTVSIPTLFLQLSITRERA